MSGTQAFFLRNGDMEPEKGLFALGHYGLFGQTFGKAESGNAAPELSHHCIQYWETRVNMGG